MIRERTRSAMNVTRARGERISGHAPFGWDFGRGGRLVPNAREQKVIARVLQLRTEGLSHRGIAERLDGERIRPKRVEAPSRSLAADRASVHRIKAFLAR